MFCSRCGQAISEGASACPSCGGAVRATTPAQALAAGDLRESDIVREALGAEYELLDELGRGGMAIVLRARETALDREVAIKVLPLHLAFDQEFVERFEREARTAAQLEHPNIIPIYRVGKSGKVPYFVMKYLRGGSLAGRLARRDPIPAPDLRRMLSDSAKALGFAARRGVVHRDIKPDNIMFDDSGNCVVTDFGIAKAMSGRRLTGTGMSIGTPHYMSPEQARAQPLDGRSDIYALGIVAYEALTGRVPFDGEDSFAIGYKHITEPLPEPVLSSPEERRLHDVIRRMTEKDPARRYQSAEELIDALEGRPGASAPPGGAGDRAAHLATAPLPAADRARRPAMRRSGPNAGREREERRGKGVWLGMLGAVALGGAAAGWYFVAGPGAAPPRSTEPPPQITVQESVPARPSSSVPAPVAQESVLTPGFDSTLDVPDHGPPGYIKVRGNFPQGTVVVFDGRRLAVSAVTELPQGRHAVGITARGHLFFTDTVTITAGDTLDYEPILTRVGVTPPDQRRAPVASGSPADSPRAALVATCEAPTQGYNIDNTCYDIRPRPRDPPFVPLPAGVTGTPSQSVLWVHVSPEGRTIEVRPRTASNDSAFERAAREFAQGVVWHPALKGGTPVSGWTQYPFPPKLQ
ncbi:MAG: protein kinase domain-containing protein [Gemmatimonadales bacterium]